MARQATRPGLALFAAVLLAVASAPAVSTPARCTIVPSSGLPDTVHTYLVGTATTDTVSAGPGTVEPVGSPGHVGTGEARPIYGQVIQVDRLGGGDSAAVASALGERGDRSAVVVPWDYDPACRPTFWSGSARWVPVGRPGFYQSLRLRPREEWAGGVPTFDALLAAFEPYPLSDHFQRGRRGAEARPTAPTLSATEYFDFYRSLPRRAVVENQPDSAAAVIAALERTRPEAGEIPLTRTLLRHTRAAIRSAVTRRHLDRIESPVAGTWRLAFSLDDGGERTFHARSRPRPTSPWSIRPRGDRPEPGLPPAPPEGYYLLVSGAPSPEALPADCEGDRRLEAEGYIAVWDPHRLEGERRDTLLGQVDLRLLGRQFPADSALAAFVRDHFEHYYTRRPDDRPLDPEGRFTRRPDGSVGLEQTTVLPDGRSLVIRGERVSARTIDCSR